MEQLYDARVVIANFERVVVRIVEGRGSMPKEPSAAEMERYTESTYQHRLRNTLAHSTPRAAARYRFVRTWCYTPLEFGYLVARKVARAIGFDIEKRSYAKGLKSVLASVHGTQSK